MNVDLNREELTTLCELVKMHVLSAPSLSHGEYEFMRRMARLYNKLSAAMDKP